MGECLIKIIKKSEKKVSEALEEAYLLGVKVRNHKRNLNVC